MSVAPSGLDVSTLNERDVRLLVAAIQSFRGGEPKLDGARFVAIAGIPTVHAGEVAWYRLKKKCQMSFCDPHATGSDGANAPAPSRGRKRKAAKQVKAEDEDGEKTAGPQKKKQAKTCANKNEVKDELVDVVKDEDGAGLLSELCCA